MSQPTQSRGSIKSQKSTTSLKSITDKKLVAVAVDSSDFAECAFEWYVKYLFNPEHEVLIIHVPEGFDLSKAQKELSKGGQMKESLERQYSKITELEERYRHKLFELKIKGTVLSVPDKTPGQAIVDTAREENAFCIVIGSRGRSKLKKAIMGSVSEFVSKTAEIPVIVVRKKISKNDVS